MRTWHPIQDFITVLQKMRDGEWAWHRNSRCKYVELRVDMRDGHCIIRDRDGESITPEELAHQFGVVTHEQD